MDKSWPLHSAELHSQPPPLDGAMGLALAKGACASLRPRRLASLQSFSLPREVTPGLQGIKMGESEDEGVWASDSPLGIAVQAKIRTISCGQEVNSIR